MRALALILLCSCGDDASPMSAVHDLSVHGFIDGGDAGFLPACSVATTAPDPLVLSGVIEDPISRPVAGATLTFHLRDGTLLATALSPDGGAASGADGFFELDIPTGGKPIDGYVEVSGPGLVTERNYNAQLFSESVVGNSLWEVFTPADLEAAYAKVGLIWDSTKGTVSADIVNCNSLDLTGATVTMDPAPEKIAYGLFFNPDPLPLAVPGIGGVAMGLNQPPGMVTITPTFGAQSFRSATVPVIAGEFVDVFGLTP